MKHLEESQVVCRYGKEISVFKDGSIWMHGKGTKRKFGHTTYKGYKATIIKDQNGHTHTVFIHRLVAEAYVPNPYKKPQVNHKNGNKADNRPENLEWCTNLENRRHRSEVLGHYGRRTPVRCVETNEQFETIVQASKATNISRGNIQGCIVGRRKTAGGYHWERA